jgi:hypothetical protein
LKGEDNFLFKNAVPDIITFPYGLYWGVEGFDISIPGRDKKYVCPAQKYRRAVVPTQPLNSRVLVSFRG